MKNLHSAWALSLLILISAAAATSCAAADSPADLRAFDTPSDGGESVTLEWESDAGVLVTIMRSTSVDGEFEPAGETIASECTYLDYNVEGDTGTEYFYRILFVSDTDTSLTAIAGPENPRRIHAALATDIMGVKGAELEQLMHDERRLERWVVRFRAYHDLWKHRGFMVMFRSFKRREDVLSRLTALWDGERRATNLLHLSEVLHRAATELYERL